MLKKWYICPSFSFLLRQNLHYLSYLSLTILWFQASLKLYLFGVPYRTNLFLWYLQRFCFFLDRYLILNLFLRQNYHFLNDSFKVWLIYFRLFLILQLLPLLLYDDYRDIYLPVLLNNFLPFRFRGTP